MDYRIQQLRYQLREDPASRYFFQLGELLRKQGELDEAAEILERGLEIHPRYVAAWVALGRTRQSAGDLVTAEEAFARALELDPEHGVAARLIGETAMARGDEIRAVTAFKLARALLGPDSELEERIADLETRTLIHGEALTDPPAASDAVEGAVRRAGSAPERTGGGTGCLLRRGRPRGGRRPVRPRLRRGSVAAETGCGRHRGGG
jgi:tetratricopeptide (TPR) repeat protein